ALLDAGIGEIGELAGRRWHVRESENVAGADSQNLAMLEAAHRLQLHLCPLDTVHEAGELSIIRGRGFDARSALAAHTGIRKDLEVLRISNENIGEVLTDAADIEEDGEGGWMMQ